MSNANDNGSPTWQEQLREQSYGTSEVTPQMSAGSTPASTPSPKSRTTWPPTPTRRDAVLAAEAAGKNRATLTGG